MKYRVVNKIRFTTFTAIVILVVSFITISFFTKSAALDKKCTEYIEIKVEYGDTLWSLAKKYGEKDKDIREVIYDICHVNNISAGSLRAGQVILIPEK